MSRDTRSFCWGWCKGDHEGHMFPEIGQRVTIIHDYTYGLAGRTVTVVRPTQGDEVGDVRVHLGGDTYITVGNTEIMPEEPQ